MAKGVIEQAMGLLSAEDRQAVGQWFARQYANESAAPGAPHLTPMEWRTLRLYAEGRSARLVAEQTNQSKRTVERNLNSIKDKMGAENRIQMIVKAVQWGML